MYILGFSVTISKRTLQMDDSIVLDIEQLSNVLN